MKTSLVGTVALIALLGAEYASAVPCGAYNTYGGILQATDCRNSPVGDATDSVADLNDGNYFGFNNWQFLTRTGESDPNSANYWTVSSGGTNAFSGTFSLASGIWDDFSSLVVVLKDGGSWHDRDYKWSAYLLPVDVLGTYNWSFDGGHKRVAHMTLYGIVAPRVTEPATIVLIATGLAGIAGMAIRRRRTA